MNRNELLEAFSVTELEDRIEFGLCGGDGGDGGNGGGGSEPPCGTGCPDTPEK